MNRINYQRRLEQLLQQLSDQGKRPKLLLHVCCAPCASHCLAYLTPYFDITLYFYNPNIVPQSEYDFRLQELRRLLEEMPLASPVRLMAAPFDPQPFAAIAKGHENDPEPGDRCRLCYALRLQAAARMAADGGYDYFCTSLSVGRRKNAQWINELGEEIARQAGVPFLPSDFKKKGGAEASVAYCLQYDLYRQNYCGCIYSKLEAQRRQGVETADAVKNS